MQKLTTQDFIERAKKVHGNMYDYSKSKYINSQSLITITCPIHGDFYQRANNHIYGKKGCSNCGKYKLITNRTNNKYTKISEILSYIPQPLNFKIIPTVNGFHTLVDNDDFYKFKNTLLRADLINGYIYTSITREALHRMVVDCRNTNKVIDHINQITFDNRKSNLRICETKDNLCNRGAPNMKKTSKYKGVCWNKNAKKWYVQITYNKNIKYLGLFIDEIEAAKAYDEKAVELHKEFAFLNFPKNKKRGD